MSGGARDELAEYRPRRSIRDQTCLRPTLSNAGTLLQSAPSMLQRLEPKGRTEPQGPASLLANRQRLDQSTVDEARLPSRPASPRKRLFDSHILEPQCGAVFDVLEVVEAAAHDARSGFSVVAGPSAETSDDPGGEGK